MICMTLGLRLSIVRPCGLACDSNGSDEQMIQTSDLWDLGTTWHVHCVSTERCLWFVCPTSLSSRSCGDALRGGPTGDRNVTNVCSKDRQWKLVAGAPDPVCWGMYAIVKQETVRQQEFSEEWFGRKYNSHHAWRAIEHEHTCLIFKGQSHLHRRGKSTRGTSKWSGRRSGWPEMAQQCDCQPCMGPVA